MCTSLRSTHSSEKALKGPTTAGRYLPIPPGAARKPLERLLRAAREPGGRLRSAREVGGGTSKTGRARKTSEEANRTTKRKATASAGRGEMVPAKKPVNMTFTVTAKERYLWTLELKRRGLTAVSVLRKTMEEIIGEAER
jgi:hypothetical protein